MTTQSITNDAYDASEMKMNECHSSNENVFNGVSQTQSSYFGKKKIDRSVINQYKHKYPTTFAELKLDGFTDSDAVHYIRNHYEPNYGGNGKTTMSTFIMEKDDYIPGSSMTFTKFLSSSA
jgi:hypothetical protein